MKENKHTEVSLNDSMCQNCLGGLVKTQTLEMGPIHKVSDSVGLGQ